MTTINSIKFKKITGLLKAICWMLQNTVDQKIQALRLKGAPVTALVINTIAKIIVMTNDRTILDEHSGYLSLS